jgi:hypothetical protein
MIHGRKLCGQTFGLDLLHPGVQYCLLQAAHEHQQIYICIIDHSSVFLAEFSWVWTFWIPTSREARPFLTRPYSLPSAGFIQEDAVHASGDLCREAPSTKRQN